VRGIMIKRCALALLVCATWVVTAAAAPRACDCKDLSEINREITEQQYLHDLFSQWEAYQPPGVKTASELKALAALKFNLAFYGVPSEAPRPPATGGGGAFGTDLTPGAGCPLVRYLFDKKGRPILVPASPLKPGEKPNPLDLVQATKPVTEATYQGEQCAGIVRYIFDHERVHQNTCQNLEQQGKQERWESVPFFIKDDRAAYAAGLKVLKAERELLRAKCPDVPCDGQWHGSLVYARTYHNNHFEDINKGDLVVYAGAQGYSKNGQRQSKRLSATFVTASLAGTPQARYRGWQEDSFYRRKEVAMIRHCGKRSVDWSHDAGSEMMTTATLSGVMDLNIFSNGYSVTVQVQTPKFETGRDTRQEWDVHKNTCAEASNKPVRRSTDEPSSMDAIAFEISAPIDPEHPNDIFVTRIVPETDGKTETFYVLRLRRCAGNAK
jgi:hypothetical protein